MPAEPLVNCNLQLIRCGQRKTRIVFWQIAYKKLANIIEYIGVHCATGNTLFHSIQRSNWRYVQQHYRRFSGFLEPHLPI